MGSFTPKLVNGRRFSARTLLAVCHEWASLWQWQDFRDLPTSFRIYVLLGGLTWIGMTGTSATFRYVSQGVSATGTALVADFTYTCNTSLVDLLSYTSQAATSPNTTDIGTSFNLNGNNSSTSWGYVEQVNSGGRSTVNLTGSIGDAALGANVTVAVLSDGWYLKEGHKLPWMAIIDVLDVSEMPQWNGLVHLYQQWALMVYAISPQCSQHIEIDFEGLASNRLFISVTAIAVMPLAALVLGLFTTLIAFYVTLRQRYWVERVEFEGWWLFKALRPDLRDVAHGDATGKELQTVYNGLSVSFDNSTGLLEFRHEYDPY
jgi:hypothetical protein